MTRKRFIKIIMAFGIPRNKAAECAATARVEHGSYAAGADAFARLLLDMCREVAQEIAPLIVEQVDAILHLARTNMPLYPRCARTVKICEMREEVAGND